MGTVEEGRKGGREEGRKGGRFMKVKEGRQDKRQQEGRKAGEGKEGE